MKVLASLWFSFDGLRAGVPGEGLLMLNSADADRLVPVLLGEFFGGLNTD